MSLIRMIYYYYCLHFVLENGADKNDLLLLFTFQLTTTDRSVTFSTKETVHSMHFMHSAEAREIFKITNTCLLHCYNIRLASFREERVEEDAALCCILAET